MTSNWPTSVWNPQDPLADDQGMAPFSIMDPGTAVLQEKGLTHDVYQEYKGDISDSSIRAWDVMENPFYQAMAEYEGYDWDTLVAQFNAEIGPSDLNHQDNQSADILPDEDDVEVLSRWGINDEKWVGRFNDWTDAGEDLIKKYKRQDAPIVRIGPSASDYGIIREDNNIFTHYGLDRPPADPTELATNYKWNLSKTWKSDVRYAVPPDLKRVNLSGDEAPNATTITPT